MKLRGTLLKSFLCGLVIGVCLPWITWSAFAQRPGPVAVVKLTKPAAVTRFGNASVSRGKNCAPGMIALLLPRTGALSGLWQNLEAAAIMAIFDMADPSLVARFYDTGSSTEGARDAYRRAVDDGACIAVGPVSDRETLALQDMSLSTPAGGTEPVPVIALTNNRAVAGRHVLAFGPSLEQRLYQAYGRLPANSRVVQINLNNRVVGLMRETGAQAARYYGHTTTTVDLPVHWPEFMAAVRQLPSVLTEIDALIVAFGGDHLVMLAGMLDQHYMPAQRDQTEQEGGAFIEQDREQDREQGWKALPKLALDVPDPFAPGEYVLRGWTLIGDGLSRNGGFEDRFAMLYGGKASFLAQLTYDSLYTARHFLTPGPAAAGVQVPVAGAVWLDGGGGVQRCLGIWQGVEETDGIKWRNESTQRCEERAMALGR